MLRGKLEIARELQTILREVILKKYLLNGL